MPHNILLSKIMKINSVYPPKNTQRLDKSGLFALRQIGLSYIAGHYYFRVKAETGQKMCIRDSSTDDPP